jgi:hypothetical protein
MKYVYPDGCCELSGFHGRYEALCREMVIRGLKYIEYNNITLPMTKSNDNENLPIVDTESKKFKKLTNIIIGKDDPSFAMVNKALQHINIITRYKWSWDKYILMLLGDFIIPTDYFNAKYILDYFKSIHVFWIGKQDLDYIPYDETIKCIHFCDGELSWAECLPNIKSISLEQLIQLSS